MGWVLYPAGLPEIEWFTDYEADTTKPFADEAIEIGYWWEDMRPKEVRLLVQQAYEQGYVRGYKQGKLDNASAAKEEDNGTT